MRGQCKETAALLAPAVWGGDGRALPGGVAAGPQGTSAPWGQRFVCPRPGRAHLLTDRRASGRVGEVGLGPVGESSGVVFRGAQAAAAVDDGDRAGEAGQEGGFFHGGVAAAARQAATDRRPG